MDLQPTEHHAETGTGARAAALLARFGAPLGLVLIGALVLIFDGNELSWLAGVLAGGSAAASMAVPRDPRSRRRSHRPMRPVQRTAAALKPLQEAGWRLLHEVRGLDTTYDHIVIGPGGVIVLQSLSADGPVTMRGGEPFLERAGTPGAPPRLQRLRSRALADASALRADVERLSGRRLWVQAVVVLWSDFPEGCVVDGRCVYIHGSRLSEWLTRRPHQFDLTQVDDVADAVAPLVATDGELSLPAAAMTTSRLSA